jgi:hypothetical protein
MRASYDVWFRVLLVLVGGLFVTSLAHAQAPPASFFEGRSNDELLALAQDPHNDVLLRRGAATRLVMNLADSGDFDAADAAARKLEKNIDPFAIQHSKAVRRRSHVHVVALGSLGLTLGLALLSVASGHRLLSSAIEAVRRLAPALALFAAYVGLVGGYLASRYENSSSLPFWFFSALLTPLVVVFRVWSAVGSPRFAAKVGRAGLAIAATLALGFLVVEQVNPSYLEGFGL